jgi:hypothetical protein
MVAQLLSVVPASLKFSLAQQERRMIEWKTAQRLRQFITVALQVRVQATRDAEACSPQPMPLDQTNWLAPLPFRLGANDMSVRAAAVRIGYTLESGRRAQYNASAFVIDTFLRFFSLESPPGNSPKLRPMQFERSLGSKIGPLMPEPLSTLDARLLSFDEPGRYNISEPNLVVPAIKSNAR